MTVFVLGCLRLTARAFSRAGCFHLAPRLLATPDQSCVLRLVYLLPRLTDPGTPLLLNTACGLLGSIARFSIIASKTIQCAQKNWRWMISPGKSQHMPVTRRKKTASRAVCAWVGCFQLGGLRWGAGDCLRVTMVTASVPMVTVTMAMPTAVAPFTPA